MESLLLMHIKEGQQVKKSLFQMIGNFELLNKLNIIINELRRKAYPLRGNI